MASKLIVVLASRVHAIVRWKVNECGTTFMISVGVGCALLSIRQVVLPGVFESWKSWKSFM
jgi:hypothetical protein